MIPQLFKQCQK